jgi:hypothetical protein
MAKILTIEILDEQQQWAEYASQRPQTPFARALAQEPTPIVRLDEWKRSRDAWERQMAQIRCPIWQGYFRRHRREWQTVEPATAPSFADAAADDGQLVVDDSPEPPSSTDPPA